MTAPDPAENAVFVLDAGEVDLAHVQEVGELPVLLNVVLGDFEPNLVWVGVPFGRVVHRRRHAVDVRHLPGNRLTQVGRERRNAAPPWDIIPDESNLPERELVRFHLIILRTAEGTGISFLIDRRRPEWLF